MEMEMVEKMTRLFSDVDFVEKYDNYQLATQQSVADKISDYVRQKRPVCAVESDGDGDGDGRRRRRLGLAVDVGCGTGQNTFVFARHFRRVLGTDLNQSMISKAKEKLEKRNVNPKVTSDDDDDDDEEVSVEFAVCPAEDLSLVGVKDASVDLLTCSYCIHYFDLAKFFAEARRVLAPHGVLAVVSYLLAPAHPGDPAKVDQLMAIKSDFWELMPTNVAGNSAAKSVLAYHNDIRLPDYFVDTHRGIVQSTVERMTVAKLHYSVRHLVPMEVHFNEHPEQESTILDEFRSKVMDVVGENGRHSDPETTYCYYQLDFYVIMGRLKVDADTMLPR